MEPVSSFEKDKTNEHTGFALAWPYPRTGAAPPAGNSRVPGAGMLFPMLTTEAKGSSL
jgi:hypothetical protein